MPPEKTNQELIAENAALRDEVLGWRAMAERYREAQAQVAAATAARGYRGEWTNLQFLARQVAKLQEELAELATPLSAMPYDLEDKISWAGQRAREAFDAYYSWKSVRLANWDDDPAWTKIMLQEATDCAVVLLNIAATLETIMGEPVDLIQRAVEKAQTDVPRGVR